MLHAIFLLLSALQLYPIAGMISPKRILVTGGNSGIGLALCKQLLVDHGCHVYLCSRSVERGKAAIESLALPPDVATRCTLVQLDVASDASVAAAASTVAQTVSAADPLFALVNNAGAGLAHNVSPEVIIDTNLRGPKRVIEAFLPLLSPSGRIVNIGSGAGPNYVKALGNSAAAREIMNPTTWEQIEEHVKVHLGCPADNMNGYGLSKACLAAYTMILAKQHPKLTINCCSPGYILTGMTTGYGATKAPEEGTFSIKHLLFGDVKASGWYFGSDAQRSPLHYMRNPGEPPYDGTPPFPN
jgi:carbonyl reductase 1